MWRACHNALATKANLFRRKITDDPLCPLCGAEAETTGHVLWGCPTAKAIWSMCGSKIKKQCIANAESVFIVEEFQRYVDMEDMELIGVVARNLWLRWNEVVYGKTVSPSSLVVSNAYESLVAFHDANSRKSSDQVIETPEIHWKAPLHGSIKVNWDAAMDRHKMKMCIGVIIRDNMGEVLATLYEPRDYIIAPDVVEATTALRAAKFSCELGFYKAVLEGDAL
jgi:hypothetical protein